MCQQAFHRLACQHVAVVVAGAAIAAVEAVATSVAAHAAVAAVAGVIQAAGSVADRLPDKYPLKKQLQAAFLRFLPIFFGSRPMNTCPSSY
jgi:hypothetical protein